MPAPTPVGPRERLIALAAVVLVQTGLGAALLIGLHVDLGASEERISRLVEVKLPRVEPPPPRLQPRPIQTRPAHEQSAAAPRAKAEVVGGSPGPQPSAAPSSPKPVVAVHPSAPPAGGGSGTGPARGSGAGGGTGGQGSGNGDEGGTDLVQIAGEILPSDYPRDLRGRGVGGRVGILFTVGTDGRVTSCTVTRSSGVPELDQLTCRLIEERFRYRPSTDAYGRPIPDEVEGEHDWVPSRG